MCLVSTPFPEPTAPAASRTEVFLRYLDNSKSEKAPRNLGRLADSLVVQSDVGIIDVDPILIELVRARFFR